MSNVTQATTISPPPDDGPPPPNATQSPPDGFPHYESYLPAQKTVSMAAVWPKAKAQFDAFQRAVKTANGKLAESKARLPQAFTEWWVWNWADELLLRTRGFRSGLADIQAVYEFGRLADGALRLSDTSADAVYPRDAEFTYYDRPLLTKNRKGGYSRPHHFPSFGMPPDGDGSFVPVPFPRAPTPPMLAPQMSCMEFSEWAWFLASPEPLTPSQLEELSHVGCTEAGLSGWCLTNSRHHEERRLFTTGLRKCFQAWVICVSDELGIAAVSLPEGSAFQDTLNAVSGWLERARRVSAERSMTPWPNQNVLREMNAIRDEHPTLFAPTTATREPFKVVVSSDSFSPFTLPPSDWGFKSPEVVTPTRVNNLRDLVGQFRSFARAYHADVADVPDDVTGKHCQIQIELNVAHFRRGMEANPWFDRLRTILRTRFNAEPSAASLNQLTNHICQESGLTVAQAETLTIEEALVRLSPEPPAETVLPVWNAETRTLTVGSWRHQYGKRAGSQEKVLAAFHAKNWVGRLASNLPDYLGSLMTNFKRTLGDDCPIVFERDGTSCGVIWRVK